GGKPLLQWHLERLAAAGCREVVVNLSHLGEQIAEFLGDGSRFGLHVAFSREAEPLETAGGIAQALPQLGAAPFLLVNADIYCELDFSRLTGIRLKERFAHLVLVPNPPHRPQGDFSLRGAAVGNDEAPRYTYAGIAVVSPALVAGVAQGAKAPLAPLLRAAAAEGRLSGELFAGRWQDVGTPERLAALENMLGSNHEHR
ncbi:MAG TPA: sugar phosphate nucleotidyltransferase, partial [Burkholderiales bacterium]